MTYNAQYVGILVMYLPILPIYSEQTLTEVCNHEP